MIHCSINSITDLPSDPPMPLFQSHQTEAAALLIFRQLHGEKCDHSGVFTRSPDILQIQLYLPMTFFHEEKHISLHSRIVYSSIAGESVHGAF